MQRRQRYKKYSAIYAKDEHKTFLRLSEWHNKTIAQPKDFSRIWQLRERLSILSIIFEFSEFLMEIWALHKDSKVTARLQFFFNINLTYLASCALISFEQ